MARRRKIRGRFCEKIVTPKSAFDRRSFRWKKTGKVWVLVGCSKGNWKGNRCSVGTKAHVVLVPSKGACRVGKPVKK